MAKESDGRIAEYVKYLMEKSTPDKPLWNIESIRQGKKAHWNYIDGCMMNALLNLSSDEDDEYFSFVDSFIDYYVRDDGSILGYSMDEWNLDSINEGRVLFPLYKATRKEKYRKAMETLENQLRKHPRTQSGNFWHKMIYPNQVWLDGIYMAQVFSALYEKNYGSGNASDAVMQIKNVRKHMFNEKKGLYYHGWDESKKAFWADKETGLSQNFWLRSEGWFLVALSDLLEIAEGGELEDLAEIFKEAIEGVSKYVDDKERMLCQVIDRPAKDGNYFETSGSAMVSYAMQKGSRLGFLNKEYGTLGREIFDGIKRSHLKEDGNGIMYLDGICLVAGLGPEGNRRRDGSYEYYISEPVVSNDAKGTAPFLLSYSETVK